MPLALQAQAVCVVDGVDVACSDTDPVELSGTY